MSDPQIYQTRLFLIDHWSLYARPTGQFGIAGGRHAKKRKSQGRGKKSYLFKCNRQENNTVTIQKRQKGKEPEFEKKRS